MRHRPFSRKLRQFKRLSDRVDRMLRSGEFHALSREKQERLIERSRRLFHVLRRVYDPSLLKRIMAGAAFLIGFGWGSPANAQVFTAPQENPFGIAPPNQTAYPTFADIDGDGDQDLFGGGTSIQYFENTGSPSSPSFDAPQTNPFGLSMGINDAVFPDLGDLDGDGDLDMIVGGWSVAGGGNYYVGLMHYYENTGSPTSPNFAAPQENPFNLDTANLGYFGGRPYPVFADIDNDGDLDLFVGGNYAGQIQFFENVGTPTNPDFAAPVLDPFGLEPSVIFGAIGYPSLADMDDDGDQELLVTGHVSYYANFMFFVNLGDPQNPDFSTALFNPLQLTDPDHEDVYGADLVDIDDDGDQDLFVGTSDSSVTGPFLFYEQVPATSIPFEKKDEANVELYPQPAKERLRISISGQELKSPFSVLNMEGKLVMKGKGGEDRNPRSLDVSDLEPGIYLLRARTEEGILSRKFVVE